MENSRRYIFDFRRSFSLRKFILRIIKNEDSIPISCIMWDGGPDTCKSGWGVDPIYSCDTLWLPKIQVWLTGEQIEILMRLLVSDVEFARRLWKLPIDSVLNDASP